MSARSRVHQRLWFSAMLSALAVSLMGCGGGSEISWCFSGEHSSVSLGYDPQDCPPRPAAPASSE